MALTETADAPARPRRREHPEGFLDRVPPASVEAEEALLGCCILDGGQEVLNQCIQSHLTADAFFRPAHKLVFEALVGLYQDNQEIDDITVGDRLETEGHYDDVGGPEALAHMTSRIGTTAHYEEWLRIVQEKHTLRRLIKVANTITAGCYDEPGDISGFVARAEKLIFDINQDRLTDQAVPLNESITQAVQLVTKFLNNEGGLSGITTGFTDLDRMTFGLHAGEMIVLAARPSMGKTSLALNMAEGAVLPRSESIPPTPTLFFSLEMTAEQLAMRMLCAHARVNMTRLKEGFLGKEQERALGQSAVELKRAPLWIDESANMNISELTAKARRMKSQHDIGLVVIDYLQLVSGIDSKAPRERQISEISRGCKALAKDLNVPVLVLSQLNREAEKEKRQPRLSDLRESGSIEQDADVVLLLAPHSEGDDDGENIPQQGRTRKLIIAKQRNGPVGDFPLTFIREYTRFENYTQTPD